MNDEDLRKRLAATSLSTPGATLPEVMRRAEAARARRRGSGLGRLALATAAVWLLAWLAQASVEQRLGALAPGGPAVAELTEAEEARAIAAGLAQRRMMEELMADGEWPASENRPKAATEDGRGPGGRQRQYEGRAPGTGAWHV